MNKPLEYWAVLLGMVLYAATRDAEKQPLVKRIVKTLASALLTLGLTPSFAPFVQQSEMVAAVIIMAFGMIILDVATAIVSDREFIKELVRNRIGGKKSEDE